LSSFNLFKIISPRVNEPTEKGKRTKENGGEAKDKDLSKKKRKEKGGVTTACRGKHPTKTKKKEIVKSKDTL